MQNTPKSPASPNKREITLSALLTAVDPEAQVLIIHHMGANCYEAVATGPAWEIGAARCVEVCGGCPVEKITVDSDGYPWATTPVLIITIGREAAT